MEERQDVEREDLRAYEKFKRLMQRGDYEKAYKVFDRRPRVTNHMRLDEISDYYRSIRSHLSANHAEGFKVAVHGTFKKVDDELK